MKLFLWFIFFIHFSHAGSLNLIGHKFTDSYRYSILDDTLLEKHPAKNVFFGSYGYVKSPFYVTDDLNTSKKADIISYNHVLVFGSTRYIRDDLALGIDLAAVNNKVFNETKSSLSDTNLKARWNFLKSWANVSLNSKLSFPTGSMENYTSGGPGLSVSLAGEKQIHHFSVLASLGYQYADNQAVNEIDYRELLLSQLGISFEASKYWTINFESYRNFTFSNTDLLDEGDYFLTFKHILNNGLHSYGGIGAAALKSPEMNNMTLFVGLKYAFEKNKYSSPQITPKTEPKLQEVLLQENNIYFANGSTKISPAEMKKINDVVKVYAENKLRLLHIVLEGYSSRRGKEKKNLKLSAKRSAKVKQELINSNIPENIISVVGYGENSEQDSDEAKNRRVQFRIYLKEGSL